MIPDTSAEFFELQRVLAGRFSLERELGRGGMGIVFLARDVALDRPVAIKLLPTAFAADAALRERFLREARTAARLSHPHIVPIHAVEEHGPLVFFVMAYVDGETLGQRVRRAGPLPATAANRVLREVAWALGYAHQRGIVHRDVKPDNILLERGSNRAMVTDFGIARAVDAETMTARGEVVGTVQYMSPEQATGDPVDGRSDLYSLGVTAYFVLTGKLPFEGANVPAVIHQHVSAPVPRIAAQGRRVPARVAEAVERCLAKDPGARFGTGEELAEALGETAVVVRELPPALRRLVRVLQETGVMLGIMGSGFWAVIYLADELFQALGALSDPHKVYVGLLAVVAVSSVPTRLFKATRDVIRRGMTRADIWNALMAEARTIQEEDADAGSRAVKRRKNRERLIGLGRTTLFSGALLLLLATVLGEPEGTLMGALISFAGVVLWGAGPTVDEESPIRALGWAERMMVGRFGKALLWLAGLGLPKRATGPALDQRTELVLGSAADELFDDLPSVVRKRFAGVPAAIERLQGDAAALRRREEELGDARARVDLGAGRSRDAARGDAAHELEAAREAVRQRLAGAVGALENIRLDLLRLHAGVGSPDDLTADLARARELGEAVDVELAGRVEVEQLLASRGVAARAAASAAGPRLHRSHTHGD